MHPYGKIFWPIPALGIGFSDIKTIECYEFIKAIVEQKEVSPNFEDGYKISLICESIIKSAENKKWIEIKY